MSKAFFRFLRGELNGFYVQNINQAWNEYTSDIKDFFTSFSNTQFEQGKIDENYLYDLGTFAGIFLPRMSKEEASTVVRFTESKVQDDTEYSERGLFNLATEHFDFFHLTETPDSDINTLATPALRSSLVGDETPLGYISSEEEDLFDDNLQVRPEKILSAPPEGVAYSEFFGNQFLFLSEATVSYEAISPELFINLFKTLQWIRYNGVSLQSLVKLISLLCPEGLIQIISLNVNSNGRNIDITYKYDDNVSIDYKLQRRYLFEFIVNLKMPQVRLIEQN